MEPRRTSKIQPVCVYHDDPAGFKSTMLDIKKVAKIPNHLHKRSAMAVCACRRNSNFRACDADSGTCDESRQENFIDFFGGVPEDMVKSSTVTFIQNMQTMCKRVDNSSAVKFICLVKMALHGEFFHLQEEENFEKTRKPSRKSEKKRKEKKRFSLPLYVSKIKRKLGKAKKTIMLPMFGGNMNVLQDHSQVGRHFKEICKKYRPCVIEVDYEKTGTLMAANQTNSVLKVWCSTNEVHHKIATEIVLIAKSVQEEGTKQFLATRRRVRLQWRPGKILDKCDEFDDPFSLKEMKWDTYDKKCFPKGKRNTAARTSASKPAVAYCLNCAVDLPALKTHERCSEDGHASSAECVHHSGYVKENCWSCCAQLVSVDTKPSWEEHRSTGCTTSVHVWRYRSTRKPGKKAGDVIVSNADLFFPIANPKNRRAATKKPRSGCRKTV
ncbi:uncharacterized protein LOC106011350 [Aplysia californica]|uniref:Uncharacterized protein LOC106011350 n=1 Tax=Aplysia californica TaxID=6500 RepID=A0ABM0ZWR8_APLCA|nr:uncharacterized protein LOC106011350 [Aplysia californica]